MLDFSEAELSHLAIHQVGNKTNEEGIIISEQEVSINGQIASLLTSYFTRPFKTDEYYNFSHETDLDLNEVYIYVRNIFNDKTSLLSQSINLARHLYEQSIYPHIKSGELYIAYFENCYLNNEITEAIGLFKSEQKETFLKVYPEGKSFAINSEDGININKLDKGCLIFNENSERGYQVLLVDNTNKGEEARYWKELFLNVKPQKDDFYHTKNYLQMCRDFAAEAFPDADKIDQMSLIQESADFFKESEVFDKLQFHEKVLQEPEIIDAFEDYKESYVEQNNLSMVDEFDIDTEAVKKMKRVFKSVIKLDKNFHIYVHGNRNYIRKGFDEASKMSFYQLFFKEES
ncbi:MAG: nucleoid-associated protein [Cytophagales bacterium]|nr:nucleoid-associated protein [Cytophagales bacterium]